MEQKSDSLVCEQSNFESMKPESSEIGDKVDRVSTSNVDSGINFDVSLNDSEADADATLNSSFEQTLSDEDTICSSFNKIYDHLTR